MKQRKRVQVLLNKGGTDEHFADIEALDVPDLWPIAERIGVKTPDGQAVIDCWHLCHDLLRHVKEGR